MEIRTKLVLFKSIQLLLLSQSNV